MRNAVFSRVHCNGTSGKTLNFSHEWKKSQIFNKDECKYLFLPFQLKNKACPFHSFIGMSMSCLLHKILQRHVTAGNRHKQNSWFCKEIRENNFRFWWRRVHEDASQGMYMSKIEIIFSTARILQNQRMLCCGECFHD